MSRPDEAEAGRWRASGDEAEAEAEAGASVNGQHEALRGPPAALGGRAAPRGLGHAGGLVRPRGGPPAAKLGRGRGRGPRPAPSSTRPRPRRGPPSGPRGTLAEPACLMVLHEARRPRPVPLHEARRGPPAARHGGRGRPPHHEASDMAEAAGGPLRAALGPRGGGRAEGGGPHVRSSARWPRASCGLVEGHAEGPRPSGGRHVRGRGQHHGSRAGRVVPRTRPAGGPRASATARAARWRPRRGPPAGLVVLAAPSTLDCAEARRRAA